MRCLLLTHVGPRVDAINNLHVQGWRMSKGRDISCESSRVTEVAQDRVEALLRA